MYLFSVYSIIAFPLYYFSSGVITPYSEQVLEIKRRLSSAGLLPTSTEAVGSSSIAACLDVEVRAYFLYEMSTQVVSEHAS